MDFILKKVIWKYQKHWNKFVKNLRKEDLDFTRLLSGHGQIRNIELNEDEINKLLKEQGVPVPLEIKRVFISSVQFKVPPLTQLKSAPIVIYVDKVVVEVIEPLTLGQWDMEPGIKSASPLDHTYQFADHVGDNIRVEVNEIDFKLATLGVKKAQEVGPWRPPVLCATIRSLSMCTTNEFFQEDAPLGEIWAANKKERAHVFAFKQISVASLEVRLLGEAAQAAAPGGAGAGFAGAGAGVGAGGRRAGAARADAARRSWHVHTFQRLRVRLTLRKDYKVGEDDCSAPVSDRTE